MIKAASEDRAEADVEGGSHRLDRMTAGDAAAALERLRGGALTDGRANLLGLDAVRQRFGDRWPAKREQVWDYVERCLGRKLGPIDWHARVGEADYLVVQPAAARFAAQALCLNVLKDVLTFFLGEAKAADLSLREVTALSGDTLTYRALASHEIAAAAMDVAPEEWRPPLQARRGETSAWTNMVAHDGRALRISCEIHPLFKLSHVTLIGHRMRPKVMNLDDAALLTPAQVDALDWGDRERVDLAMLQRGLARLKSSVGRKPAVVVPLAFSTISSSRGRSGLVQAFCDARDDLSLKTVVSLCNVRGVPPGRLAEVVSLIQPFCFAVTATVDPERAAVKHLAGCGLRGLAFKFDRRLAGESDVEVFAWLKSLDRLARPVAPVRMIAGLSSPRHLALARLAGLTHASLCTPEQAT